MQRYVRPDGMPPVNGYAHAVAATGSIVHVSGQLPLDVDGALVGAGDAAAQARQVFANLATALAAAGAGFEHVVKLTYYLTDLGARAEINRVRDTVLDPQALPASALVQVSGLVLPGALLEIDAVAVVAL